MLGGDGCHFEVTDSCLFIIRGQEDPCRENQVSGRNCGCYRHDGPALKTADVSSYTAGGTIMEGPFFK